MSKCSSDILKPVSIEEWPVLQEKIKIKWPLYAYNYNWVGNAINWKKKDPEFPIQLYTPTGDSSANTIIGISNFSVYIVTVFTTETNCETLMKIIKESKYINWSQGVYFAGVHNDFLPSMISAVDSVKAAKNIEGYPISPGYYYFKDAEECSKVEIRVPDECYLKNLDKSHIPMIHSVWPHKDPEHPDLSTKYLGTMVEMNGGIGLFLKEDDSLVSWALHTDWNGMGMVQTVDQHRRKGYAKVVVNALAKKLGQEGISTTLFIVGGNTASENMFQGLGFKNICLISWIVLKRPEKV